MSGRDTRRIGTWAAARVMACLLTVAAGTRLGIAQCELGKSETLSPPNGENGFGKAVSIAGELAVVGADNRALVYRHDGSSNWVWEASLQPTAPIDNFGWDVSVSGDAIAVGGHFGEHHSVAVFRYDEFFRVWLEEAQIPPPANSDGFGRHVALEGDILLVGDRTSVYVFRRDGTDWNEEARLISSHGEFLQGPDSLALDDNVVVVGDSNAMVNGLSAGAAFVFRHNGGQWVEEARLISIQPTQSAKFGFSADLQGDLILIGSPSESRQGSQSGAAYVFRHDGGQWTLRDRVIPGDAQANLSFGQFAELTESHAVIGTLASNSRAYVFSRDTPHWLERATLVPSGGTVLSLASSGNVVFMGSAAGQTVSVFDGLIDCNSNGIPDECDIANGTSLDLNNNGIPDECEKCDPCDMNCDGTVDAFDIEPFLDLLFNEPDPCCEGVGDVNGDGTIDAFDIEPFLECLFP